VSRQGEWPVSGRISLSVEYPGESSDAWPDSSVLCWRQSTPAPSQERDRATARLISLPLRSPQNTASTTEDRSAPSRLDHRNQAAHVQHLHWLRSARGGITASQGLRTVFRHRTACFIACERMRCIIRTLRGDSPPSSRRPLSMADFLCRDVDEGQTQDPRTVAVMTMAKCFICDNTG